jgi:hypothetical protein
LCYYRSICKLQPHVLPGESTMCLICLDFKLGKLTRAEALRNAREFIETGATTTEHLEEIRKLVDEEPIQGPVQKP